MAHLAVKSRIETGKTRLLGMPHCKSTPKCAAPVYNQAYYEAILAERYALGATDEYVDLAECMRAVGREVTNVTPKARQMSL